VFFRKELPQQDDVVERAKQIFCSVGAKWSEYRRTFAMPGGGRVRFRPLLDLADAEKYQGQNLSDAAVEEAGNYPSPAPIDRLFGCLRSTTGVPIQLILTANPAGPGHQWIKMRYVDPAPHGMRMLERKLPSGNVHRYVFIPSKVQDNQILLQGDPGYVDRLHLVGNEQLVKAWLEGDWSVIAGAFFPEFSMTHHVRDPFEIPESWSRYRACDWGSAKPFSVGWYAISDGSLPTVPRGCLVKYREWYGMQPGQPNVGLKMTAEEVADGIKLREAGETINQAISRLDPSCFAEDGGPSIAERMLRRSVIWNRADNTRVGRRGAMGGWDQVRARLIGEEGWPMILFFSTCQHTIRTLPALQHDQASAEDVDTDGEDHACFAAGTVIDGLGSVEEVGQLTGCDMQLVRLHFDDGSRIDCTPNHKFLADGGQWIAALNLAGSRVSSAQAVRSLAGAGIGAAVCTFSAMACDFIAWCGNAIMAPFLPAAMFTTSTGTALTTDSQISRSCAPLITYRTTQSKPQGSSQAQPEKRPQGGTGAQRGSAGTPSTLPSMLLRSWRSALSRLARYAGERSRRALSKRIEQSSAIKTARQKRCVGVEPLPGLYNVYCLGTAEGWLSVNGLVASNCDETRYACMARPWVATKIERKPFDFVHIKAPTFNDLIERNDRPQARRRI
jgi:hypothetical protein